MRFVKSDGGRKEAGFEGKAGDCVCRALAIVTGLPYIQIYTRLSQGNLEQRNSINSPSTWKGKNNADEGVYTSRKWFKDYMIELGFEWVPTMSIGSGCKVHMREDELPKGRLVVRLSKHLAAVIDGVLYDTGDCTRRGTRCVYGYYILKTEKEKL